MSESDDHEVTTTDTKRNPSVASLEQNKSNVNIEPLDDVEADSSQAVYQIRPQLSDKFKPQLVKELIDDILHDHLAAKKYSIEEANKLSRTIADSIRIKVKELHYRQYKYVVNVILGESRGAGMKMGTRCIWDAEADSYAHGSFKNETIFCVACVYAVFYY
ncbi:tctex1 domain-containing protein 2 [Diachasma alloeum]|uniref:tctex1 domain-containing protein 2 n=1 Tax=Diachasma alloeum TaxID=454923 RepID=UPI000738457D|nr:tctex1 domain-containing protein 2 [Diachasma alloeum]